MPMPMPLVLRADQGDPGAWKSGHVKDKEEEQEEEQEEVVQIVEVSLSGEVLAFRRALACCQVKLTELVDSGLLDLRLATGSM